MRQGGSHLQPKHIARKAKQPARRAAAREPERDTIRREEPRPAENRRAASHQQEGPWREEARRETPRRAAPPQEEPRRSGPARTRSVRAVETEPPAYRQRGRNNHRGQSIALILLIVVLAGGLVFAGGKLASILLNYRRDRTAYNDLASLVTSNLVEEDGETDLDPNTTPDPDAPQDSLEKAPISVDWSSLQSINSDVVGWLYCPGTNINYPVMQTIDNSYYLRRGIDKQSNTSGSLFADVNSVVGITQSNYIIYGHNMKDGSMLATVEKYVDQSYYQQHPVMYFLTPSGNYRVDLIAAHIVESTLNNYPGYFTTTSEYQSYLNEITSRSFFSTSANVSADYQLITMSTCDYSNSYDDPRMLLHGLLIPIA